ncbi:Hypothetical predicted protein [Olea europaea subsp. europaea]|uniref:Uncharacterized protein n=1 Tax=Olea europaea subsp. europaea TaxID=158383 RepID=A0A8S0V3V9_OLEEU|nr:Hypothetical predicted protein [Olea europaea subsp. europaea]
MSDRGLYCVTLTETSAAGAFGVVRGYDGNSGWCIGGKIGIEVVGAGGDGSDSDDEVEVLALVVDQDVATRVMVVVVVKVVWW